MISGLKEHLIHLRLWYSFSHFFTAGFAVKIGVIRSTNTSLLYALAAGYMSPKVSLWYHLMKFCIRCQKHSLCSALGNTAFTAFSKPLHASAQTARRRGSPIAFFS